MKSACPRRFEVEALRDGRLTGVEVVRFQSHLAGCPVCARETRDLQALAEALRGPTNSAEADELHVRRERTRLLAAFDASLVAPPRRLGSLPGPLDGSRARAPLWLRSTAAVALLSLLAALSFVLWPARPAPSRAPEAALTRAPEPALTRAPEPALARAPEPVTIRADSSARWSRRLEAGRDEIVLESGVLSIRVDHAASPPRLLVLLPDGELEDIGTTFSVSADGGRTTRVTVQDGSVVLRLHDTPPLELGAGDSWSAPPLPAATLLPAPPLPAPAPTPAPAPARRSVKATPSTALLARRSPPVPDPSADFRAAMAAFDSGDSSGAATAFAAFLRQHPRDLRAEDAAYLRILALQRAGNHPAAQQAAHDYLSRYPRGFRRAEVEALSR